MQNIVVTTPTFGKFGKRSKDTVTEGGYELRCATQGGYSEQQIIEMIDDNTVAILTGLEPITEQVLRAGKNVKTVGKHGVGVDNIDLNAAKDLGIRVFNTQGTNADAVADLAFGLMCSLARNIPQVFNEVREGAWPKSFGTDVWGKTIGIIGFGDIGKKLALRARGFNMRVLAFDLFFDEAFAKAHGIEYKTVAEILPEADFISLHMPLTEQTRNLIGAKELQQMKNSAYLVNTSRGGVVDEGALYQALTEKAIAGAALDVFTSEPPQEKQLLTLPNFIGTPHMGGYTDGALDNTSFVLAQNLIKVLSGQEIDCFVN